MRFSLAVLAAILLAILPLTAASGGERDVQLVAQATDWARIQQRLNELGFDAGKADGQPGARTRYAITAFQNANDRPPTGKLSDGDMALLFGEALSAEASVAAAGGDDFEVLPDTDLPFGDYRSGKEDPGLKNISMQQCLAACRNEQQCQAFTYNEKHKFCFLKETSPAPMAFEGAISGRRVSGEEVLSADASPSTQKLIGAPRGCAAQEAVIERLRKTASVSMFHTETSVGSAPLVVNWVADSFPERLPVYLIASTSSTVRFDSTGTGFYALTEQGRAAFDIQQFAGTIRVVFPLYGEGAPEDGSFMLVPLEEGTVELKWDVVGVTDCGEQASPAPQQISVAVAPGAPQIIAQNLFADEIPSERLAASDGRRVAEAFGRFYRLYDAEGHLVTERVGQQPRFSPTGRFLSAWINDYVLEIIDTVDGSALAIEHSSSALGWTNGDSFYVSSLNKWGLTSWSSPLAGPLTGGSLGQGCHACQGIQDGLRFDLENNYILLHDAAASLTTSASASTDRTINESPDRLMAFMQDTSRTVALRLPVDTQDGFDWDLGADRPLTSIPSRITMFGRWAEEDSFLEALAFEQKALPIDRSIRQGDGSSAAEMQVAMRGPSRVLSTHADGLQNVRDALSEIQFASASPVGEQHPVLQTLSEGDYHRIVPFPGFDRLRIAAATSGCNVGDISDVDGTLYGYSPETLHVQTVGTVSVAGTACAEGSAAFMSASILVADARWPDRLQDITKAFSREQASPNDCAFVLGVCGYELRAFAERYLVFWSNESEAVAVYDADAQDVIASYGALPRAQMISDVSLDASGRWLVLHFPGDLFSIVDLTVDQKPNESMIVDSAHLADPIVLEGMVSDGELVAWNDALQFDATAEGAEFVSVRFAGRRDVYALTQFEGALRRKGLLAQLGDNAGSPPSFTPPPVLGESKVTLAATGEAVDVALAWTPGTLSRVTVLQDGLITDVVDLPPGEGRTSLTTQRVKGGKWVTLLGQDEQGVASRPYSTALGPDPRGTRPVRLLAIGIDKYADAGLPTLPLARADAINIEMAFVDLPLVSLAAAEKLVDDTTDSASIRGALARAVSLSQPDETLVLSLSGHGIRDANGELYLATRETRLDDMVGTAIPWSEIAATLSKARGRVVIFLDTCHSGIAGTAYAAPSEGAVEDFLTAIPSNLLIFSASKGRQSSQEKAALGGGVFSNALIKALGEDRATADANANGALEISELYGYLRQAVTADTDGEQTPWFARNKMVGDFAVF